MIGDSSKKIGNSRPAPTASADPAEGAAPTRKGRGKKLLIMIAVAVLAGAGAGYWLFLRPAPAEPTAEEAEIAAEEAAAAELGAVQPVEPISINLADGHYLRLGLGLQLTIAVVEDVDVSKAVDRAIALFSMRPVEEVGSAEGREALKAELATQLEEAYEGEIVDVYFTTYVTQ
ncbi:flagellar basal body-associated FliL family protein [Cellulomonas marina]|uniref:Flagellar protein FliL n=1 Tax=Cellulomonas marina TaxID=988821 RepID=A0A1I0YY96_9CELL|nr:flagellar basal body-associated FliL family protein [Cellulomonas marina]SFB17836.1 flagellar FliL protein [Cellulomonas marina]